MSDGALSAYRYDVRSGDCFPKSGLRSGGEFDRSAGKMAVPWVRFAIGAPWPLPGADDTAREIPIFVPSCSTWMGKYAASSCGLWLVRFVSTEVARGWLSPESSCDVMRTSCYELTPRGEEIRAMSWLCCGNKGHIFFTNASSIYGAAMLGL